MPLFSYKAVDRRNRKQTGKIEKDNEQEVRRFLKDMDYYAVEIKQLSVLSKDITDFGVFNKLSYRELSIFCRQLSQIIAAGANIGYSLKIMIQQSSNPVIRNALIQMSDMLKQGGSLAECMSAHRCFPGLLVGMVKVGESGGSLSGILERLAVYYKKCQKSRNDFIGMMIYPAMVSAAMLAVIIMALILVIPNYAQMFLDSDAELPWITSFLIDVSSFLSDNYGFILAAAAAIFALLRFIYVRPRGRFAFDWLKLNAPVIKSFYIYQFNLQFMECLSLMLNSGQQLLPSLKLMRGVFGNRIIDTAIARIIKEVSEGGSFSRQLYECQYFSDLASSLIGVGEESARLTESVSQCAEILSEDNDVFTSRMNKIIEPAIILVLGLVLAAVMMAIMLPVFSLTTYI